MTPVVGRTVLAAMLLSPFVYADDAITPIDVRTHTGPTPFLVATPNAAASAASRVGTDLADKAGRIPDPAPGYTLTNRVIVRTDDGRALASLIGPRDAAAPTAYAPGFWIVTAPNVSGAIALAESLAADPRFAEVYVDIDRPKPLRSPTDPGYPNQWHLNNALVPIADINAEPAWDLGIIGTGVVIGILEGGWQYNHPDLAANYNADATQPGGTVTSHGTSCAGVAGAVANNGLGGVGAAYGAQISGQIFGSTTQTASAFAYRNDLNDIKSNSWGPWDDGTMTYMPSIEYAAIEEAVATGRSGLGEIFTWAAGNGGLVDRVEYDPYASSRYTIAVGAIGDLDYRSSYNEEGSSMFVVAHSSGNNRGIYTTTSGSSYTSSFGGTSSASPLGAGVVGLVLQANPALTWRDVQHVLAGSARMCDSGDSGWTVNAAGHALNYYYGFGAVEALEAVNLAATWTNVGPELVHDSGVIGVEQSIPDNNPAGVTRTVDVGQNLRIESVELYVNVTTPFRGDLQITLTAPSGTESLLTKTRSRDSGDDLVDYRLTTFRCWDEESAGTWTVNIADKAADDLATWHDFRITIYGTEIADCPPDFNGDGLVNSQDFIEFLNAFTAGDPGADFNGDGNINSQDFIEFLNAFVIGC